MIGDFRMHRLRLKLIPVDDSLEFSEHYVGNLENIGSFAEEFEAVAIVNKIE